ncbi:rRNA methyltransferase 3 mitochondrial-like [Crotalus adamanteus]|uniref:rRNA methyltransferase 3 mitochondrial-like n=1 Tax=Crotalus adamanteus TaxID=8729 RepID=A0AAW1CGQ7_CROAD
MATVLKHAWARLLLTPCRISVGSRRGIRGLRRKPLRVLPSVAQVQEQQRIVPSKVKTPYIPKAPRKERQPEPEHEEAELRYERAGPNEKRLRNLVTLAKSRAFREKHGKILLEGRRLIMDALEAGAVPQTIFFSLMENLKTLPAAKLKRATLVKVKYNEIKMWSDVITPQGLIGIFAMPHQSKMSYPEVPQEHALPLTLICDNIRDPGNLGTILRSAAGAGCCSVLLVKGCVDAWEPKVLRAGMGAHFRIPIVSNLEWDLVPNYLPTESRVHVAESRQEGPPGEAEGASAPQAARRGSTRKSQLTPSKGSQEEEEEEERQSLQVQPYYKPWMMDASVAIVVGGETHGVSPEAKQLAQRSGGKQLAIPVVPGVESLNSAMAAGVLLFEAKRQLLVPEGGASRLEFKQ